MRGEVQSFLELAFDYLDAGLWADALEVLKDADATYPMVEYARGYALAQMRQKAQAAGAYAKAAALPTAYCFPFRAEEKMVLEAALKANPKDARALLYLGNLLYDAQPEAALAAWEKSGALDKQLPLTQRNLGWAYYRLKQDLPRAAAAYENAVNLNGQDPRLLMELDAIDRWMEMLKAAEALAEAAKTLGNPPSCLAQVQALVSRIRTSQDPLARPLRQHLERHWPGLLWNE